MSLLSTDFAAPKLPAAEVDSMRRALEQADPSVQVCVAIPCPVVHPLEAAQCLPGEVHAVYMSADDHVLVGAGNAIELQSATNSKPAFEEIKGASQECFAGLVQALPNGCPAPVMIGGFSFAPKGCADKPWEQFGSAYFSLPEWLYRIRNGKAWLYHTARSSVDWSALWHKLQDTVEQLAAIPTNSRSELAQSAQLISKSESPPSRWHDEVELIRAAISEKHSSKIVAARCTELRFDRQLDPGTVFKRLQRRYPDCHCFHIRTQNSSFLGATPELLIRKDGYEVFSEALAGSIAAEPPSTSGELSQAQILLRSEKDRWEQDLVAQALRETLAPLCQELRLPDEPEIRRLRHLLHLHTPVRGTLLEDRHILELVAKLHPTPAVGGVPRKHAQSWISDHEAQSRGWYAAPVGWFDESGQGEFVVAIRAGLLRNDSAHLYAGAGIVADSDSQAEYEETALKLRPLLDALGVLP